MHLIEYESHFKTKYKVQNKEMDSKTFQTKLLS